MHPDPSSADDDHILQVLTHLPGRSTRLWSTARRYTSLVRSHTARCILSASAPPQLVFAVRRRRAFDVSVGHQLATRLCWMAELLCLAGSSTTQLAQSSCDDHSVTLRICSTAAEVVELIAAEPQRWLGLVLALGTNDETSCWPVLKNAREIAPQLFVAIYSHTAQADCKLRLQCFGAGARMVTAYPSALDSLVKQLAAGRATVGPLSCAYCGMQGLSEDALHRHLDLFHTYEPNIDAPCPICSRLTDPHRGGLAVHYHNNHGPPERREAHHPGRAPLTAFALVRLTSTCSPATQFPIFI